LFPCELRKIAPGRNWIFETISLILFSETSGKPVAIVEIKLHAFARELEKLHPGNRHARNKIRRQLQVLRDMGF
jgi:hypothetical protein